MACLLYLGMGNTVNELIVDAYGCAANLSDATLLEKAARAAVESVGARVAQSSCHRFQPHGITLCLILQESHFVLSTWPEHGLAIMNVFLCNETMDARKVWEKMAEVLKPTHHLAHTVRHQVDKGAGLAAA